jgi:hypothetical protein
MLAGAWAVTVTSLPFAPAWWRAALAQCLTKRQRRLPVSPDFRSLPDFLEPRKRESRVVGLLGRLLQGVYFGDVRNHIELLQTLLYK